MPMEVMLRVDFLQNWYGLSDPMAEETLYDSEAMRCFAGIELGDDRSPDEATILNFRHLLERHGLTEAIFADVNAHLADKGITYVEDLVEAIRLLIDVVPVRPKDGIVLAGDSLSPVAPWRVVNIGNLDAVQLNDFIAAVEEATGLKASRNPMEMQAGDIPATWVDASLLKYLTGYQSKTTVRDGLMAFVKWYKVYYGNAG